MIHSCIVQMIVTLYLGAAEYEEAINLFTFISENVMFLKLKIKQQLGTTEISSLEILHAFLISFSLIYIYANVRQNPVFLCGFGLLASKLISACMVCRVINW